MDLRAIFHAWCGDPWVNPWVYLLWEALVSGGFPDYLSESSWI
jgi:hypothetical protein